VKRIIRLRGMNGAIKGRTWESSDLLRVGRLDPLEIVLEDSSVSRYHAEVRLTERGWRVRDLGSTNGTRLNGVRLGNGQWPLRLRDLLQFGEVAVVVETLVDGLDENDRPVAPTTANSTNGHKNNDNATPVPELRKPPLPTTNAAPPAAPAVVPSAYNVPRTPQQVIADDLMVEGTAQSSWEDAVASLAFDNNRSPRAGEQMLALLRASHSLVHMEKEEDLLNSVLFDAVSVLDAQRGAIVLAEGPENKLKLKALVTGRTEPRAMAAGRLEPGGRFPFSQSLAARCVTRGESILCHRVEEDPELAIAKSIAEGSMASVLCVLLRTPRKRLGVLHLDRSPWQKPFTMDDLKLADGLAAHVSAGIECAQLLRKQRDLFLDTITILAQAVELRDEYTGGHTFRVSTYSLQLAEKLGLPAEDVELIKIGTPLHDIGKIGIDDAILRKTDKLTPEEFEQMKLHTVKGAEIIATVPDLRPILPIVRHHHERWDGRGYPDALEGEAISPLARVVSLADAFDAMTSDRPYRKGMPPATAFAEIEKQAGRQFDPRFAAAFLSIREALISEMQVQAQARSHHSTRKMRAAK
jgi:putative nucleotidyltransferase with HDIG domain